MACRSISATYRGFVFATFPTHAQVWVIVHVGLSGGGAATSRFLSDGTCRNLVEATLHAPIATYAKDTQGRFVYVNRCWASSALNLSLGRGPATQCLGSTLKPSGPEDEFNFEQLLAAEQQALDRGVPVVLIPGEPAKSFEQHGGILIRLITSGGPILVGMLTLTERAPQAIEHALHDQGNNERAHGRQSAASRLRETTFVTDRHSADHGEPAQSGVGRPSATYRQDPYPIAAGPARSDDPGFPMDAASASCRVRVDGIDREIVAGVARGDTTSSIANRARCSDKTVERRLALLRRSFDVSNTTALIARCYSIGLLLPGEWPPRLAHPTTLRQANH